MNSFTVGSTGAITAAAYIAVNGADTIELDLNEQSSNTTPGLNQVSSFSSVTSNDLGFAGVTYTLVTAVPEPSSVTLLGIGLGAAALWQLRRRRQRGAAA